MKLYTVAEAAKVLRMSRSKLYELIARGKITHYRSGGIIVLRDSFLEEYLDSIEQKKCEEQKRTVPRKRRLKHFNVD